MRTMFLIITVILEFFVYSLGLKFVLSLTEGVSRGVRAMIILLVFFCTVYLMTNIYLLFNGYFVG